MNTTEAPKQDLWDTKTSILAGKIRAAFSEWCMFCMQCAEGTEERILKAIQDPTEKNALNSIRYGHTDTAWVGVIFAKAMVRAIDRRDPIIMKFLIERDFTDLVRYHHLKDVYLPDVGRVAAAIPMAQDAYFDRPVRSIAW